MVQDIHLGRNQHLRIAYSGGPKAAFDAADPCLQKQQATLRLVRDMATARAAGHLNFARACFLGAFEQPWRTERVR